MLKVKFTVTLLLLSLSLWWSATAAAQGTAFTYQGKLTDSGNLANGQYDLQFKLFDALAAGTQQGTTQTLSNVTVTNGIFTVSLDFGVCATCFNGAARFLEIAVRPNGGGSFTTLSPRQPITSTPYALKSQNATSADGLSVACVNCVTSSQIQSVNGSAVTGTIPVTSVPAGSANYIQNSTSQQASSNFNISGTGTADIINATTRYNINGQPVLSAAGSQNLFAGINAGTNNTGTNNAFFGSSAGNANTNGNDNAFFGAHAGQANTGGLRNAFFGRNAGTANTTGFDNAFFGGFAGQATTIGQENAFFGNAAGNANTNGSFNTIIGKSADFTATNTTGNNNTLLGGISRVTANISNATAIGFRAQVTQSNSLVLGGITGVNGGTDTSVGIGTTVPAALLDVQRDGTAIPEIARFTSYGNTTSNTILARSSNGTRLAPAATPNGRALLLLGATGHDGTAFVANPAVSIVMDTAEAWTSTANGTQIRFRTTPNGGTAASDLATRLIITNDGNVGIGTSAPQFRLHVAGDINTTTQYNLSGSRVLSAVGSQNLFAGINAGTNNTGTNNAFFGSSAGNANTNGNDNAFFGANAGQANTTGYENAFFGNQAGQQNTTGYWNTFFGSQAGQANTDSHDNAFFGFLAGTANSLGIYNAFFGSQAGQANTSGFANSFFGAGAGFDTITGGNNTFIGYFAKSNGSPTGDRNTLLGASTQVSSGVSNGTAIGYQAQVTQSDSLVLGNSNVKVGIGTTAPTSRLHVVGDGLFTGNLTVNGTLTASLPAGSANYIQNQNAAPQAASNFNISGTGTATILNAATQFNFNGQRVLSAAGTSNLFAGVNAGTNPNNTGFQNAFFGSQAGVINTTGSNNAFFGGAAGFQNTTGNNNAFFGYQAGQFTTTGNSNAFFGTFAGSSNNTFIGRDADFNAANTTGDNNNLLGAASRVTSGSSNATAIGFKAQVEQSNSLVLGGITGFNGGTDTKVGIGITTPAALLDVQRDGGTIPETARFTTYGTGNEILSRLAGGTRAAPATPNGTFLLQLGATGHDGTQFVATPAASINMDTAEAWTPTAQGTQIRFRTTPNGNAAGAIATRMIITNDGNIGIGTSAPADKLHVNGILRVTTLGAADTTTTLCRNSNSQIATCNSSSLRYKTAVQPFVSGLEIINRLRPITFTWKQSGIRDLGFAAEEVAKVEPLFTFTNNKGEVEGVKYDRLSVLFVNAFKEQQQQLEHYRNQLADEQQRRARDEKLLSAQQQQLSQQQREIDTLKRLACLDHPKAAMCKAKK